MFAPNWFADAFITLISFLWFLSDHFVLYFSIFLFKQYAITFLLETHRFVSIKNGLHEKISILSSVAPGPLNNNTSKMVTDLHDAECEKRKKEGFQIVDEPPEDSRRKLSQESLKKLVLKNRKLWHRFLRLIKYHTHSWLTISLYTDWIWIYHYSSPAYLRNTKMSAANSFPKKSKKLRHLRPEFLMIPLTNLFKELIIKNDCFFLSCTSIRNLDRKRSKKLYG